MLSEWRMAAKDWPAVTEAVHNVLNNSPLRRLGPRNPEKLDVYRTPLEVFMGHRPICPLIRPLPFAEFKKCGSKEMTAAQRLIDNTTTQKALDLMHKDVGARITNARKRAVEAHNRKTNVQSAKFCVGDFVLVRQSKRLQHKVQFAWRGQRQIVEIRSEWVYVVENLHTGRRETVHARRLHVYIGDIDGKQVSPHLLKAAEHTEAQYQTAE